MNGTEADLQLIKDFMIETDLEDVFDECSEELDRGCDHPDSSDFASTCHILGDELTRSYRFFHCGIETITEVGSSVIVLIIVPDQLNLLYSFLDVHRERQ